MTTYTTTFNEQLGSSFESYTVTIEYCEDFTGDGLDDIRITITQTADTNSGTEDIIGVAFDLNDLTGLTIGDIQVLSGNSTFVPVAFLDQDNVSDNPGATDPGFSTTGGGSDEPYDAAIKVSEVGSGEGIVQSFSFVISGTTDLDAEALLEGTDWWIRTQSTDGGSESAKTGGFILDLPPCGDEPPNGDPGNGNTPGFWKNHQTIFEGETGALFTDSYEALFGVDVLGSKKLSDNPTLLEALSAKGGGEAALLRSSTAAWANATSDDTNFVITDVDSLEEGVTEAYGLDPLSLTYAADLAAALAEVLAVLTQVDDGDGTITAQEVIDAVGLVFADPSNGDTGDGADYTMEQLSKAFDAMNNMPSLEADEFVF